MIKPKAVGKNLFIGSAVTSMVLTSCPVSGAAYASSPHMTQPAFETAQTLRFGHQGKSVRRLQRTLKASGTYNDNIDGIYGANTQAAVEHYQRNHDLFIDGIAGKHTLTTLYSSKPNTTGSADSRPSSTYLDFGDRGKTVHKVQKKLKTLGFYSYQVDGIFGPRTESAVKHYQMANGLQVDGIVGPQTKNHLYGTHAQAKQKTSRTATTNSGLIADAKSLIGTPYQWGGSSPGGFDCSGFLKYVFESNGINIPRTVSDIWNYGISVAQPRIGDLVFFETYKAGPSHAGIYLGNDRFLHTSSDGVEISRMSLSYWQSRYLGAKKIVQHS